VDGSFYARVNLSDFDVCRLRSCVRPFDAVDITAGLDEVRTLGPNQTSELVDAVKLIRTPTRLLAQPKTLCAQQMAPLGESSGTVKLEIDA